MSENVRVKYAYKKDFVKAFKYKCKKENIKYTEYIKACMCVFINENEK